jgi:hypothetical protein
MSRFVLGVPGSRTMRAPVVVFTTLVLLVSLFIAACGSSTATVRATATMAPTPMPTPAILFQADWSRGLGGWQATPGWSVVNGVLRNDPSAEQRLTIPFQPPAGAYAIEIELQVVNVTVKGGFFLFDVPAGPNGDGFETGITGLRTAGGVRPNGDHPTIRTLITPLSDQDTTVSIRSQADYEPGDQMRTYRIVVDGKALRMYVDGRFYVSGDSTRGPSLVAAPLLFHVDGAVFHIAGLRIYAL